MRMAHRVVKQRTPVFMIQDHEIGPFSTRSVPRRLNRDALAPPRVIPKEDLLWGQTD